VTVVGGIIIPNPMGSEREEDETAKNASEGLVRKAKGFPASERRVRGEEKTGDW